MVFVQTLIKFIFFQVIHLVSHAVLGAYLTMLPVRIMKPVKASKQTTAAASKIKNKILSESVIHSLITLTKQFFVPYSVQLHYTICFVVLRHFLMKEKMLNHSPTELNAGMPLPDTSFFKVSLKTNNKALALALQAQKERSSQLEKEIVHLQKQVEALCFELATKKYKHRKLVSLLFASMNLDLQ